MARNTQAVQSFCERITNVDPDLRQMALFDLQEQLNTAEFSLSEGEQEKVVQLILVAFTAREVNSEVHSQSVRILTSLVRKVGPKHRQRIADHLVSTLWDQIPDAKNPEAIRTLRENALMGLKALIEGLTEEQKDTVSGMVPRLLAGMNVADTKIKGDVLDVLGEIVRKFGRLVADKHQTIQEVALGCFNGDLGLRKKAVACAANLCAVSSDELFNQVLKLTIDGLKSDRGEKLRRHIQLCNTITRVAADRFGAAVEKVVPFLFAELNRLAAAPEEESQSTAADEVRENILQALDSFVSRCPTYIGGLLPEVIDQCGKLLRWDPNYCEMDETEDDMEEMEDVDDDDESSWKVRKSAARCLLSLVQSRPDQLGLLFDKLCGPTPILPARFKERVENVRLEVLEVFRALLEASKVFSADGQTVGSFQLSSAYVGGSFRMTVEAREEVRKLYPVKTQLMSALLSSVRHKSPKVKLAVFTILRDLFALIGSEICAFIPQCAAVVAEALGNPKLALPQLRPDVLNFARVLVNVGVSTSSSDPAVIASLESLFKPVFAVAEKDRYFKTVVAALRVCQEFVGVVRVSAASSTSAQDLFKCVHARLCTADADQDVKKAAIDTMASVLRSLEPSFRSMSAELDQTYRQCLQLLKNETTRLTVCKAIIAMNRCKIPPAVAKEFASELATFLRKTDRQLREAALRTLGTFVPVHQSDIEGAALSTMVNDLCNESTGLLSDKELFLTSLGLQLLRSISQVPSQAELVVSTVVPKVLSLVKSPLIQGQCITDAATLFKGLAGRNDVPHPKVLAHVVAACRASDAQSIGNLATILGATVVGASPQGRQSTVSELCGVAQAAGKEVIGLTCLGEIGRSVDVSGTDCVNVIRKALSSNSEEVKAAAGLALGKTASAPTGGPILQTMLADVQAPGRNRYFVLRALKECIIAANHADGQATSLSATDQSEKLFELLVSLTTTDDEAAADVVAECLGRLCHVDVRFVGKLAGALKSSKEDAVAVVVSALRHAATGVTSPATDEVLKEYIPASFEKLVPESSLKVRRAVIQLLTQVVYAKPHLLRPERLQSYVASLLKELEVNTKLISEVDLGPFKHIVDNGLEVRKLAYECLGTLIDSSGRNRGVLDSIGDLRSVVDRLALGLGAPELDLDIIASARSMLIKLSKTHAGQLAIAANVDRIADALKKTAATGPKDGQEKEKVVDGQKHAIVCALKLEAIPGIAQAPKFAELVAAVRQNKAYAEASQQALSE